MALSRIAFGTMLLVVVTTGPTWGQELLAPVPLDSVPNASSCDCDASGESAGSCGPCCTATIEGCCSDLGDCQPGCQSPCPVGSCCRLCGTPADFCDAFTDNGPCDPSGCRSYCHSSCDMPQHMAYHPESHGYYYLKPYNYQHLPMHQQFVASFGGDRRNPYDTRILDNLSDQATALSTDSGGSWQPGNVNPFGGTQGEEYEELSPGSALPMEVTP